MRFFRTLRNQQGDSTMVLMTTLNMLLLAFFIVLNSFAVLDNNKIKKAWGSLLGTLGILSSGLTPGVTKGEQTMPKSAEISTLKMDILTLLRELEEFAVEERLMEDVNIQYGTEGVTISLTNTIGFEKGEARLKPAAKEILARVAVLVAGLGGELRLVGHTSPGRFADGSFPDDWTLSFARAGAAAQFILGTDQVSPTRLSVSGYGSTRPLLANDTPEHIRQNDRLEMIVDRSGVQGVEE